MDSEAMFDHIERMLLDESAEPSHMSLSFLTEITNNFAEERKIGSGGFAVVYQGRLRNGRSVAVKKFHPTTELSDDQIYKKEVESLMRLKHKNIVRFFGYCAANDWKMVQYRGRHVFAEERQRLLCFEFVPGGSLDKHLSDISHGLVWRKRYEIIRGICEGLHYLHEERVLHLDLKPSNILLDNNLVPKITDFGVSKYFDNMQTQTFITKNVIGSMGYMAPESFSGVIAVKSDVYSLGIIITEILTGKKGYCDIEEVLESWKTRLKMQMGHTLEQIRVCVEIGLMCIDSNPHKRPDVRHVIELLNEMEIMYMVTETTSSSSSLLTQGSDEHVSEDTNPAAITDEKLSTLPKNLPFKFLQEITDNFSEKRMVGRGVFGAVYMGILSNGPAIAVRKLHRFQGLDMKHFANEVNVLMKLTHKNIVNLLGYCHEERRVVVEHQGRYVTAVTSEQLLCYDYMSNGSIDRYIFGNNNRLDWSMRHKMIKGICEGLRYLHEGPDRTPIIHLNLKPSNVLLDETMEPRITDFGLSRLIGNTRTVTQTLGPIGYMAPEYLNEGLVSLKADIYSLGILILEVVTGQEISTTIDFIEHVRENYMEESQIASLYPSLEPELHDQVELCIVIGLECVQTDRTRRPTAGDIIRKLEEGKKLGPGPSRENTTEIGKPEMFKFKILNHITNTFDPEHLLGEGAFGCVYQGKPHGNVGAMAVKRFNKEKIRASPKQFENEVHHLSRIEHKNVVRLIGYCDEIRVILSRDKNKNDDDQGVSEYITEDIQERLLCYEYMPKGSLEKRIYGNDLDWHTRYKIIEGICEGLHYLHEGQQDNKIVHLDLKPANILLDSDMVPKLADFGMSRLFKLEQVYIIASKASGTPLYMAPEYLAIQKVSPKADIYSFGIIVLEIVTRRLCRRSPNGDVYIQHFINLSRRDDDIKSMYPDLEADCLQQVKLCIEIGLKCVDKDPTKRPTAEQIISKLKQKGDSNRSGESNCIVNVIEACTSRLPWHPWPLSLQ